MEGNKTGREDPVINSSYTERSSLNFGKSVLDGTLIPESPGRKCQDHITHPGYPH